VSWQKKRRRLLITRCVEPLARLAKADPRAFGVKTLSPEALKRFCLRALIMTVRPIPDSLHRSWNSEQLVTTVTGVALVALVDLFRPIYLLPLPAVDLARREAMINQIYDGLIDTYKALAAVLVLRFRNRAARRFTASELLDAALQAAAKALTVLPPVYFRAVDEESLSVLASRVGFLEMTDIVDASLLSGEAA
jgi:hypothetical protein